MKKMFALTCTLIAASSFSAAVQAFEMISPVEVPITKNKNYLIPGSEDSKVVTLLRFKLTPKERDVLINRQVNNNNVNNYKALPKTVDLSMNGVPVLDQGRHGTCVTFAVAAAIDAVLGKSDYISELCSLELGSYLESNGYVLSGWDGSFAPLVLTQMMYFGVVNKTSQKDKVCAHTAEYPLLSPRNHGKPMSLSQYKKFSEDLTHKLYWRHIFGGDELFDLQYNDPALPERVFQESKQALAKGSRLTFATFIILAPTCDTGACASYKSEFDTWALTKEIEVVPYEIGAHEVVIYGYDDNAVAHDRYGGSHKGLFKIRNSWGTEAGDNGDYYLSYDYFMKYVLGVEEIVDIAKKAKIAD